MIYEPDPPPSLAQVMTEDEQALLAAALAFVIASPEHHGEVVITVHKGAVHIIKPAVVLYANLPTTGRRWLQGDPDE